MRPVLVATLLLASCGGKSSSTPEAVAYTRIDQTVSGGVAFCNYHTESGTPAGWCWQTVPAGPGGCYVYDLTNHPPPPRPATPAGPDAFGVPCYP